MGLGLQRGPRQPNREGQVVKQVGHWHQPPDQDQRLGRRKGGTGNGESNER